MARGVNKVILVGNLGKDPEIRYAPNGSAVANISLATSESWKDKTTGEKQEKTEWHRYTTEVVAGEMQMLGSRNGLGQPGSDNYNQDPGHPENKNAAKSATGAVPSGTDDFDDDIPF